MIKKEHPKYLDKGYKKNRLTVINVVEFSKIKNKKAVKPSWWKYKCLCECGNITYTTKQSLCAGNTQSCGCAQHDAIVCTGKSNKKINKIEINKDVMKIFFFNTSNYAIIDTEDYTKVKEYCWYNTPNGYARASMKFGKGNITLHRIVMGSPKADIDHKNRNKLDCRKSNLRLATRANNCTNINVKKNNKSGYTGVRKAHTFNKWVAYITNNKQRIYLGTFKKKQDAINVRCEAEIKYFGEFAPNLHQEKGKITCG